MPAKGTRSLVHLSKDKVYDFRSSLTEWGSLQSTGTPDSSSCFSSCCSCSLDVRCPVDHPEYAAGSKSPKSPWAGASHCLRVRCASFDYNTTKKKKSIRLNKKKETKKIHVYCSKSEQKQRHAMKESPFAFLLFMEAQGQKKRLLKK